MAKAGKKTARIELAKDFYSRDAVRKSADIFSGVAEFKIEDNEASFIISITSDEDIGTVKGEFMNFVLGMMKETRDAD